VLVVTKLVTTIDLFVFVFGNKPLIRVRILTLSKVKRKLSSVIQPGIDLMVFELFDKDLMNSFSAAQDERQLLGRNYLSSDVLLLGLLKTDCLASKSLQHCELTFESVKKECINLDPVQEKTIYKEIAPNINGRYAIDRSFRWSIDLGDRYIGTEHFLLALTEESEEETEGVGAFQILKNLNADIDKLCAETLRLWRMKIPSLYKLLESDFHADRVTLERAYEMLAAKYDPDNSVTGDYKTYTGIKHAWLVLGDDARRAAYDRASVGLKTL
jgi:DnaJ domain/Clp amino terminal domain, pathogenicity island component